MPSILLDVWYDIGDRVKLSAALTDSEAGDALTDPTALVFTMFEPDGTRTVYTLENDPEVVHDSVGVYHVYWNITQAGNHWWRFQATGNLGAAEERGFKVYGSKVLP